MTGRRTFYSVQVLRGVAALLVVVCHVVPGLYLGNAGVDLFFVISGFVIVWTTHDSWHQRHAWRTFLEKRMLRIFPLYWILTTAKIAVVLAAPGLFRDSQLTPWNTFASYLLIPSFDATGSISPVMAAGWTLCFEMAFYYVCAACLALNRRPVAFVTPVFGALSLIGLFRTPAWGPVLSLIDPLLLEFVAGMWIADRARRGAPPGAWAMWALLALGVLPLLASGLLDPKVARAWRVAVWGAPAAMIVHAMIGLEGRVAFSRLRLPLLLGDASYSIYLAHVLAIGAVIGPVRRFVLPAAGSWGMDVVLIAVGIGGGVVVWQVVERKIIRGMAGVVRPRREAWIQPR